jgi:hypothetical protein
MPHAIAQECKPALNEKNPDEWSDESDKCSGNQGTSHEVKI